MSSAEELTLRLCNDPLPAVSRLAVVWPAGDPAAAEYPTVIAAWLRQWDDALDGALFRQQRREEFAWMLNTHLWRRTQDQLPFANLLLLGATPRSEAEWPGWIALGEQLGGLLASRPGSDLGLVVDRIFATGLEELATGLFVGLGAAQPTEQLVISGSIAWTEQDRAAVLAARNSAAT